MYHINSFDINTEKKIVFAGDKLGNIYAINAKSFEIIKKMKGHHGTIQTVSCHKNKNLVAFLGKDFKVSIWSYNNNEDFEIKKACEVDICNLKIEKINRASAHSESQALSFHHFDNKVYTRTGNGGIVEIDFSEYIKLNVFGLETISIYGIETLQHSKLGLLLIGTTNGLIHIYKDTLNFICTLKLNNCNESVHWLEPCNSEETEYFIATDARKIYKINLLNLNDIREGALISNDDLEHVSFNGKKLFATSFDRNIYEVDPITLDKLNIIYKGNFKIRWLKFIDNENIVFQVRNGELISFNVINNKEKKLKSGGNVCLWSADFNKKNNQLTVAGFNNNILSFNIISRDINPSLRKFASSFNLSENYIKRIIYYDHFLLAGSSDGNLYKVSGESLETIDVLNLSSPIRDIAFGEGLLFVALESGEISIINVNSFTKIDMLKFNEPIWSLSYNPKEKFLAVCERIGNVYILILENNKLNHITSSTTRLPKRAKWFDHDLFISRSSSIDKIEYDQVSKSWEHKVNFFEIGQNTVEDFAITFDKKYLVCITYAKKIFLLNYNTGDILDQTYDSFDYSKGIMNISDNDYDFCVIGRYPFLKMIRIHDQQLLTRLIYYYE